MFLLRILPGVDGLARQHGQEHDDRHGGKVLHVPGIPADHDRRCSHILVHVLQAGRESYLWVQNERDYTALSAVGHCWIAELVYGGIVYEYLRFGDIDVYVCEG